MMVYKCDSCKKELTDEHREGSIRVNRYGTLEELMLCEKCGRDIVELLREKGLIPPIYA